MGDDLRRGAGQHQWTVFTTGAARPVSRQRVWATHIRLVGGCSTADPAVRIARSAGRPKRGKEFAGHTDSRVTTGTPGSNALWFTLRPVEAPRICALSLRASY